MSYRPSITRNILSNWGGFVFAAATGFFISPFVVKSLGETQYGAWVLLGSMVGNLGLLDIGVRAAVTRYVARFHAAGEHERSCRLYTSAVRIFSIAGAAAIALSAVMAVLIGRVFQVPHELLGAARIVAVVGGASAAVSLIGGVFGGILVGLHRFETTNAIEIVVGSARIIGIVLCLSTGKGLVGLSLVQLAANVGVSGAAFFYMRRAYPQLRPRNWIWDGDSARMLVRFGLTASIVHVSYSVMLYSDSLVIGAFLPVAMITHFSIGATLIDYARSVIAGISRTLTPWISSLEATKQESMIQDAMLSNARIASIVVYPIAVTFILRGESFVGLWMGPEYAQIAGQVLVILSMNLLTLAGYQIVSAAMFGVGRHGGLIPVFIVEGIINVLLSIVLVRHFGVLGTAFGTMIPRVIVSAFVGPWYAERVLHVSHRRFWREAFLRPAIAVIPFAAASLLVERTYPAPNLFVFFAEVIALLPLMAAAVWIVCLSGDEKATLLRAARAATRSQVGGD
ncbi:MAG TPA: polysaccharide biosynthesis C-terminal domain-containing protein [Vicinamibacterales bacterium]